MMHRNKIHSPKNQCKTGSFLIIIYNKLIELYKYYYILTTDYIYSFLKLSHIQNREKE